MPLESSYQVGEDLFAPPSIVVEQFVEDPAGDGCLLLCSAEGSGRIGRC